MTQRLAQREILAVGVDDRVGPFEAEPARRRADVGLVGLDADHLTAAILEFIDKKN